MKPISLAATLVFAGMAVLSTAIPYQEILRAAKFLSQSPTSVPTFNVSYDF